MSISKSITATAIMKLVQQGRFKLTSKVFGPGSLTGDKYGNLVPVVNGIRQYNPGITVQNLLEHQAGWGVNSDPEGLLRTMTPAQAVPKSSPQFHLRTLPARSKSIPTLGSSCSAAW